MVIMNRAVTAAFLELKVDRKAPFYGHRPLYVWFDWRQRVQLIVRWITPKVFPAAKKTLTETQG